MRQISLTGTSANAGYNKVCTRHEFSNLEDLLAITSHNNWCPAVFRDNSRHSSSVESLDIIGLDIDSGCTIAQAQEYFKEYKYLLQPSRHHQKEKSTKGGKVKPACDRFRLILELEQPITDKQIFTTTVQMLLLRFPFIDAGALTIERFFFMSSSEGLFHPGNLLSVASPSLLRGRLSGESIAFIQEGKVRLNWNETLYRVARDFNQQGYGEDDLREVMERWTTRFPGMEGTTSAADNTTIQRAFVG